MKIYYFAEKIHLSHIIIENKITALCHFLSISFFFFLLSLFMPMSFSLKGF